jgi:hypothetical protein
MDSLFISKDLQGRVTTQISIQGSGAGNTQAEAVKSAEENMKQLQTILIKLKIQKLSKITTHLQKIQFSTLLQINLKQIKLTKQTNKKSYNKMNRLL